MVGVAQRPRLVRVKVCVSSDAGAREVRVGQETPLTIKRRAVTMETRGKEDHDVSLLPLAFDFRVRHLLNGIRGEQSIVKKQKTYIKILFKLWNRILYLTVSQTKQLKTTLWPLRNGKSDNNWPIDNESYCYLLP